MEKLTDERAMEEAIKEAYTGIQNGDGGPFGTVIVMDGKIIGRGHNCVIKKQDPTCHGEMEAIRDACRNTGTFNLNGAILYTTAEPCPMCLGGILWANITTIYKGCSTADTEKIGFRDKKFYEFFSGNQKLLNVQEISRAKCLKLFSDYESSTKKSY